MYTDRKVKNVTATTLEMLASDFKKIYCSKLVGGGFGHFELMPEIWHRFENCDRLFTRVDTDGCIWEPAMGTKATIDQTKNELHVSFFVASPYFIRGKGKDMDIAQATQNNPLYVAEIIQKAIEIIEYTYYSFLDFDELDWLKINWNSPIDFDVVIPLVEPLEKPNKGTGKFEVFNLDSWGDDVKGTEITDKFIKEVILIKD